MQLSIPIYDLPKPYKIEYEEDELYDSRNQFHLIVHLYIKTTVNRTFQNQNHEEDQFYTCTCCTVYITLLL
jgi:hypothetical protein